MKTHITLNQGSQREGRKQRQAVTDLVIFDLMIKEWAQMTHQQLPSSVQDCVSDHQWRCVCSALFASLSPSTELLVAELDLILTPVWPSIQRHKRWSKALSVLDEKTLMKFGAVSGSYRERSHI